MTTPMIYLHFPGTARDALAFYAGVFGGELSLHTNREFNNDGDPDAIAHGTLDGAVTLAGADAARQVIQKCLDAYIEKFCR